MLIRITLIVAIVAALGVVGLNVSQVRTKITTLINERDTEKSEKEKAQQDLAKTRNDLKKTQTALTEAQKTLEATTAERDKAVSEADTAGKRAVQLADELARTKKDRDDAQAELAAYRLSGLTPLQVMNLGKTLRQTEENLGVVQQENKVLGLRIERLEYQLAKYQGSNIVVYLKPDLKGKVLVSDPKWNFVVLSVGEEQGAREDGELLVNRDGQLVAKVVIRSVQKDRCIANVLPGWKLAEVMEGDQVIPAHPSSS